MNFKEFLLEKKKDLEAQTYNGVYDVNCHDDENLTEEEKTFCRNRELLEFIRNSYRVNS